MPEVTLIILIILCITGVAGYSIYLFRTRKKRRLKRKKQRVKQKINSLSKSVTELSPQEFMKLRSQSFGGRGNPQYSKNLDFAGVYVLYNKTKNKYYVGQGQRVLKRVNMHFTGKGNGDVYADYKYGDDFTIKMIRLKHCGFKTLNELEREAIAVYKAYATGYNKTQGNKD